MTLLVGRASGAGCWIRVDNPAYHPIARDKTDEGAFIVASSPKPATGVAAEQELDEVARELFVVGVVELRL